MYAKSATGSIFIIFSYQIIWSPAVIFTNRRLFLLEKPKGDSSYEKEKVER